MPALLFSLLTAALAQDGTEPPPVRSDLLTATPAARTAEIRVATRNATIYRAASTGGATRGLVEKGDAFRVYEHVGGTGCPGEGWARTDADGFVCLANTAPATAVPTRQPDLVPFDPPTPEEFATYRDTGVYERSPPDPSLAILPDIYGKPWRQWKGRIYANQAAFERGAAPLGNLEKGRKAHFVGTVETTKGTLLVRENGQVIPADDVWLYPVSRHAGRDLQRDPVPAGMWIAWATSYEATKVFTEPRADAPVAKVLPYHSQLLIRDHAVDPAGHWWEVPDAVAPGIAGYVEDIDGIRHPNPATPPEGLSPTQVWYDVDLATQTLTVHEGHRPIYITMVSTGEPGHSTPVGLYTIYQKAVAWDMASRADVAAEDVYYVEAVPWTMHFRPRYALHGAYWHWGYGHTASHGCVNLSLIDAKYLFDLANPSLPDGWSTIATTKEDLATLVRVRQGQTPAPDRRSASHY